MYKKIQTTSTKCQYQAAASKPKWCPGLNWWAMVRDKQINRKVEPIITWRPWNPVATKKVAPYTLSAIEKAASKYSIACKNVKYPPNKQVKAKAWIVSFRLPSIKEWCPQVTVTPEANNTAVFNKGIAKGFSAVTPVGGQLQPNSGAGANLLWKNAQKNAKKKRTSEAMKRIMPHRNPLETNEVWKPIYVPSRITSRHHCSIVKRITNRPIIKQDRL